MRRSGTTAASLCPLDRFALLAMTATIPSERDLLQAPIHAASKPCDTAAVVAGSNM